MSLDFRLLEHLYPRALAWRIVLEKQLTEFFEGLTVTWGAARTFIDEVYLDLFPETTRALDEWEAVFNYTPGALSEQQRRDRLDARWKAQGGQSPNYIQGTIKAVPGFEGVFVHEWWSDLVPTARDPNLFLSDTTPFPAPETIAGEVLAQAGEAEALAGNTLDPIGYPLVNKQLVANVIKPGAGDPLQQAGEAGAQAGEVISFSFDTLISEIPTDPALFPFFVYVGAETFPDTTSLPANRRDEFESLLLTLMPQQLWIGVLVQYT